MSKNEKKVKSSCFVTQIDLALSDKIKNDLVGFGFSISKPLHTVFSAKKKGVSVSLYQSGKLMVQGKEMGEFIEFYLEPEVLKSFTYSHPEEYADMTPHMGSDEAGKGDFFGPLCIAAVYADREGISKLMKMGLRDTKKLSDKKTLDLAKKIKEHFAHHIVRVSPEKYNQLYIKFKNLNQMLAWGHSAAIDHLYQKCNCPKVIIDQFASKALISPIILKKSKNLDLILRTKAEEDVVVAAAAILARATFLYALRDLGELCGQTLPKGASQKTKEVAISIAKEKGIDFLEKLCKKHFQTYDQVLQKC